MRGDTLAFLESLDRPYLHKPFSLAELRRLLAAIAREAARWPFAATRKHRHRSAAALVIGTVVHVASGREWRGGQRQVWLLARELQRRGDVAQVVVTGLGRRAGGPARARRRAGACRPWRAGLDPRVLPPSSPPPAAAPRSCTRTTPTR